MTKGAKKKGEEGKSREGERGGTQKHPQKGKGMETRKVWPPPLTPVHLRYAWHRPTTVSLTPAACACVCRHA